MVVVEEEDVLLTVNNNWDSCAARCKFHMGDDQWDELESSFNAASVSEDECDDECDGDEYKP